MTSAEGIFSLPPEAGAEKIIAVHKTGYAELELGLVASEVKLELQPWGSIEGTLKIGSRLGTNELVSVGAGADVQLQFGLGDYRTRTDSSGRFTFYFVPPGNRVLFRWIHLGEQRHTGAYRTPITIRSGEATQVMLGGTGRTVIGRATRPDAVEASQWQAGDYFLYRRRPRPPASLQTKEEIEAWRKLPANRSAHELFQIYPVIMAGDGSFRAEEIPAGEYQLTLRLSKLSPERPLFGGRLLAIATRDVTVPAPANPDTDEPLDLGTIELQPPKPE
jgi:hypothetical protein